MSIRFRPRRSAETACMEVAPGVMLEGQFHAGSTGDRDVPGESSWVDVDSIKVSGRPDQIALWVFDTADDLGDWREAGCPKRSAFLEELAGRLRDHHEEEVPS